MKVRNRPEADVRIQYPDGSVARINFSVDKQGLNDCPVTCPDASTTKEIP